MYCSSCGFGMSSAAKFCNSCGQAKQVLPALREMKTASKLPLIFSILMLLVVGMVGAEVSKGTLVNSNKPEGQSEQAIATPPSTALLPAEAIADESSSDKSGALEGAQYRANAPASQTQEQFNPEKELSDRLMTLSLSQVVAECEASPRDSRERQVIRQTLSNRRLPNESSENILDVANQMVPDGDAYGELYICLSRRGIDPIDKLSTERLVSLMKSARYSEFYPRIQMDLLNRVHSMSNDELMIAFNGLPPLEPIRIITVAQELKSRGINP